MPDLGFDLDTLAILLNQTVPFVRAALFALALLLGALIVWQPQGHRR